MFGSGSGKLMRSRRSGSKRYSVQAALTLTSLVDIFTVSLVYLLVSTTDGAATGVKADGVDLPSAIQSSQLEDGVVVQVRNGQIVVDEKVISPDLLVSALKQQIEIAKEKSGKENLGLIIEADKNSEYDKLNPIMLASQQAGFARIKLAVAQEAQPEVKPEANREAN